MIDKCLTNVSPLLQNFNRIQDNPTALKTYEYQSVNWYSTYFYLFAGRKRKPRLGSPHPNSLNNSANNRRLHSANRRRSSPNISNQSFSENNNNNYTNPNRKFSRATSYAESFQGLIHHIVSPNWFTNFHHKFLICFNFEQLKKKRKQFVFSQFAS